MPIFITAAVVVGLSTAPAMIDAPLPPLGVTLTVPIAQAKELLSVEQLIDKTALENGIASTTLYNLAMGESSLNPNAVGDKGCSLGISQINVCAHKAISEEEALDPVFALDWAAKKIKDGDEDIFSVCNCYAYIQANFIKNLPRMKDIVPNTSIPHKGMVAVFFYTDKQTGQKVKHIAFVLDDKGTISEANKTRCKVGTRVINSADPFLAGYYDPSV